MIISAAAFGQRFPWPEAHSTSDAPPPGSGRKLAFITALQGVVEGTLTKLMLPNVRTLIFPPVVSSQADVYRLRSPTASRSSTLGAFSCASRSSRHIYRI